MKYLIEEYEDSKRRLLPTRKKLEAKRRDEPKNPIHERDLSIINSMIRDLEYSIEWLETEQEPKVNPNSEVGYDDWMTPVPDIWEQLYEHRERKRIYIPDCQMRKLDEIYEVLSSRERQCYEMHKGGNMSMQKIANELGISKATVQQFIRRAQDKIDVVVS